MLPGDSLIAKVFEGIPNAQAVIVVVSEFSVNKPWVREELNAAVIRKINGESKLIPVVIGNIDESQFRVWLGPIVQRRSTRRGRVRYRLSDLTWEDKQHPGAYTFYIKVFNEREQGTGIRDVDCYVSSRCLLPITTPTWRCSLPFIIGA